MGQLDMELEDLQEKIDNNPAYIAEGYKKAQRQYGTQFITEDEIGEKLTAAQAKELSELQDQELIGMEKRLVQLKERQALIDKKEKIMERHREIELILWKQKIQEKEMEMKGCDEILKLKRREVELDELWGRCVER